MSAPPVLRSWAGDLNEKKPPERAAFLSLRLSEEMLYKSVEDRYGEYRRQMGE